MKKKWKETFALWGQSEEHKEKVKQAKGIIEEAVQKYRVYSTFSGGKDSLVVSHLANAIQPEILVVHLDYGQYLIPRDFEREITRIACKLNFNFRVVRHSVFEDVSILDGHSVMHIVLPDIAKIMSGEGYEAVLVGLRSQEACRRKARIKASVSITSIKEFYPVGSWTWMDIWAYIVINDLPYLSYYDVVGDGIGWDKVRFTTLFDKEFEKYGSPNIDGFFWAKYRY